LAKTINWNFNLRAKWGTGGLYPFRFWCADLEGNITMVTPMEMDWALLKNGKCLRSYHWIAIIFV